MTKVLFIIWSLERGGAERFLAGLLKHLDRTKFDPVLCCLNWKGEWAEELEREGLKVIALNKKNGLDFQAIGKLVTIIREGQFKIVNTHLWAADVMGRVAACICRVPIVITTAQNVDIWKKWWHRFMDKILSYGTSRVIAVSKAVKIYYNKEVGIPKNKINVIPNAIDVSKYENIGDCTYLYKDLDLRQDDFILACVGRLNVQKGHTYLFESLSQLKVKYPHLRVLIVGEGEEKDKLLALANKLNIESMLRFTGQRSDIANILHISKALILPSIFEGLPLCVLEAMASSRAVIATDVGGTKELAIDQKTSFIIEPKKPEQITQAITKLIELPDHGESLGQAGKEVVESSFTIQAITKQTENLFEQLVGELT